MNAPDTEKRCTMPMRSDRGVVRSPQLLVLLATCAHLAGCLLGTYLAMWVLAPRSDPNDGSGMGADGLAAGFLMLFALVQAPAHGIVATLFRRDLLRRSPWRYLGPSVLAGMLSMLMIFALLQTIPRESMERYPPLLVLGSFLLPGFAVSVATLWWASRIAPDGSSAIPL
jgi:hypothetical protein